ncbi:epoxyqueuosine reductase QueH [candidate division KSB1 bacterium]|nr:epoxyqueuosine reductase QueH [candidate division KSB1 bacterium]
MSENKKILVHTCCAPCAAPSGERLILHGYEVTLFFSNSNIYPKEEYDKRLFYAKKLASFWNVIIEEDQYDHPEWIKVVKGLENEPEKGARCVKCFEFSIKRTAEMADRLDFPAFTTTLTLSPHKISKMIFEIGKQYDKYIPFDFKKEDGFLKSIQLSREYDLYRQNYCGCEFSLRDNRKKKN